jgi:hypothetical protein
MLPLLAVLQLSIFCLLHPVLNNRLMDSMQTPSGGIEHFMN